MIFSTPPYSLPSASVTTPTGWLGQWLSMVAATLKTIVPLLKRQFMKGFFLVGLCPAWGDLKSVIKLWKSPFEQIHCFCKINRLGDYELLASLTPHFVPQKHGTCTGLL
jgi:hypothetical protein